MSDQVLLQGLPGDEQQVLTGLLQKLAHVRTRNDLRDSYYDGKRAITQVGSIIPPSYYKLAIVLGWSAKAVDTLAHRCNLDGFVWPDGDLNSLGIRNAITQNRLLTKVNTALTLSMRH